MHQRLVAFAPHRLHHAQRGERVHETRGAFGCAGTGWQHQALLGLDAAVLRIHGASQQRHGFTQQGLRGFRGPGLDHHTRAFIAYRHGLVHTARHGLHRLVGNAGGDYRALLRARHFGAGQIGGTKQQAQVGWIEGRGFDAHQHFVRPWFGHGHAGQRDLEFAAAFDQGAQLQRACGYGIGHGSFSKKEGGGCCWQLNAPVSASRWTGYGRRYLLLSATAAHSRLPYRYVPGRCSGRRTTRRFALPG